MGYWSPDGKPAIKNYTPDDTEDCFWCFEGAPLSDILNKAQEKWGDEISFDDIYISGSTIHTRCLTYDLYDPSDYDDYIKIERIK